jgi:diguanylate cyclase (GGDEF)-like protein
MGRPRNRSQGSVSRGIVDGLNRVFVQLIILIGLMALTLAIVFAYLIGSVRPDQERYRTAGRALNLAHAAMIDQETGLRGYLLTHESPYLEPYYSGVATLEKQNATLERNLGGDLSALLLTMRVAEQAWQSEWATEVVSGKPGGGAELDTFYAHGRSLFDRYRTAEAALNDRISARRDSLFARQGRVLTTGLVATLLLGGLLVAGAAWQRRRLKEAVFPPVIAIVSATEAIARNDLAAELVPSGASEFRRIGESINQMRGALAEARDRDVAAQGRIEIQAGQLRNILAMSREISGSLNLRYVLRTVANSASAVSGFERAIIWLAGDEAAMSLSAAYDSSSPDGLAVGELEAELGVGVVGQAIRYGRTATENASRESSVEVHVENDLRSVAIPLVVGARVTGAIELSGPEPHRMTRGSVDVLETLAMHAAAAIEAASLHTHTEQLAHTDALTGLANRRRLDHELALECERSARYQRPFALIMFDVDHFKRVNDNNGHTRGDEILQQLAEVVRQEVRTTDSVYRYGGEEFVVLARETDHRDAGELAERLRARIEAHFSARGAVAPVTASFGIALVPPEDPDPARVVASADAALYRSKEGGRNRVSGPPEPGQERHTDATSRR